MVGNNYLVAILVMQLKLFMKFFNQKKLEINQQGDSTKS